MAQQDESLAGIEVGGADEDPRAANDTNFDVLPSKRTKVPNTAAADEEKEIMSKRKKRKLEQLAQKKAMQEQRSEVLAQLKAQQMTSEQAALLQASHSTPKSRRAQLEQAKQRIAMGVPLTADMRKLRRRPEKAADGEEEKADGAEAAASSTSPPSVGVPARVLAATAFVPGAVQPVREAPRAPAAGAAAPKAAAATAQAAGQTPPISSKEPSFSDQPLKRQDVHRTDAIEEIRSNLPAVMMEQETVEMALANDVMLVCGETGCGKSTQVPQFLFEAGFCNGDQCMIAVTQPRRVAAISVSQRVEEELNSPGTVGYQVRYDTSHCSKNTKIKFMTDGILLREVQADFLCKKYSVIIIDEAHERGVNCDILIGLLSRAVQQRRRNFEAAMAKVAGGSEGASPAELPAPPLKLVIMSATLRLCDFTENKMLFPTPPPVLRIEARTFPVTAHFARRTEEDYIKAARTSVLQIHKQLPPGTILVFVTGRQEVHRLVKLLNQSAASAGGDWEEDGGEAGKVGDDLGQLEASDDEGGEFDDDLEGEARAKAEAAKKVAVDPKQGPGTFELNKTGRRKKKRTFDDVPEEQVQAEAKEEGVGKKKKRKKGAGAKAPDQEGPKETPEDAPKDAEIDDKEAAEANDECEVNYRIDAEEDVVVLDPDAEKAPGNAKEAEEKAQKKIKMKKLDRSRTAGGVFMGAGFGEGPIRALPLYAQLPARQQLEPFEKPRDGERVVVVSTNVAETSVTLPNVRYVVDSGHEKRRVYKQSSGVSAFAVARISKASADQRAGRAGRLGPGHTYRLYSAAAYENHFTQFAPIPILHTPMDPVLLLLAFLGVPRLDVFPWPTPPSAESVATAMRRLRALGAIEGDGKATTTSSAAVVKCTTLGYRLASLPVGPRYGKMLLSAIAVSEGMDDHIVGHACAIVAAMSLGNLTSWESFGSDDVPAQGGPENELVRAQREAQRRLDAAQKKEAPRWSQLRDDAEGLLWLMGGYSFVVASGEAALEKFCRANRINARQMSEAHSLMQQLAELLNRRLSLETIGTKLQLPLKVKPPTSAQWLQLRDCVTDGLIDRVAVLNPEQGPNAYTCADLGPDRPVFIHNSSNAYRHRPRPSVIVFNEVISTIKPCMRDCVAVDPLMLARRATSGTCDMLKLGEFLPVPAPRYLKDKDQVMAFCSPIYGPLAYSLPTVELDVPADMIFRYKVFAKALLEGEVVASFPPKGVRLLSQPSLVLHAPTNPRVQSVVGPLWAARVGSRRQLLEKWQDDGRFLLEGALKWLPASSHENVSIKWPPSAPNAKTK